MAYTTQQPILKIEIINNCLCTQHLVGGGKFWVYLIDLGPSRGLMAAILYHPGECHDWQSIEAISDVLGASCFILDVEVELLQLCGPLLMAVILQFSLCLHELQWLMISVDDCVLPKNVISPLATGFHYGLHFFIVSRVLTDSI
jgi:hypothetical protein